MTEDIDAPEAASESPGIWQRIKNGISAVVGGIVSSVAWTVAALGVSYLVPKKYDYLDVQSDVKGKDAGETVAILAKKALPLLGISAAINGVLGFAGFGTTPQPTGPLVAQTNLPRNPQEQKGRG